jgi:hypothetical protein
MLTSHYLLGSTYKRIQRFNTYLILIEWQYIYLILKSYRNEFMTVKTILANSKSAS